MIRGLARVKVIGHMECFRLPLGLVLLTSFALARADELVACADSAEMPPFVYTMPAGSDRDNRAAGVTIDLLGLIAREQGWKLRIELVPWGRCMLDAQSGRYAMVLDVGEDEARSHHLLLSRPFYSTHGVYLYSRTVYPNGLTLTSAAQMSSLKVCGMGGHQYESFGIPAQAIDQGTTKSFGQMVTKLQLGRCDIAVGTREEVAGLYLMNAKLGHQISTGELGMEPLPGEPERRLYLGVPEGRDASRALLASLNSSLERLEKGDTVGKLVNRHLAGPDAPR